MFHVFIAWWRGAFDEGVSVAHKIRSPLILFDHSSMLLAPNKMGLEDSYHYALFSYIVIKLLMMVRKKERGTFSRLYLNYYCFIKSLNLKMRDGPLMSNGID